MVSLPCLRYVSVLGVLFATLSACTRGTSLTPTASSNTEIAANFQALSDIPIPGGATLDSERSLILGNMDRWTGRVVMKLNISMAQASGLFQQQMPSFGWQPLMAAQAETAVLTFLRGDRAATILVSPVSLIGGSVATITVAPRQSEGAPSALQTEPLSPPNTRRR
jgi:hypothetical protein